ncbi:DUF721 domain-containing protein [Candidatus Pelagibacter sp.]|jgi:hypothetical protein|nr:DUF721 domain-containing protein [Candidatus Pelagibacter sp.]
MNFKYNTKQRTKSVQGLRSFKDTLPQEAKRILNKKGQIYSNTLENWKFLVGKELFNVSYPRSFKNSKLNGSCLNIMVKRGNEVDLEYSKKEIIKKMNIFFGYNVVDDIKLKTFEGEFEKIKDNKINNATKSKNIKKITNIKNDKIKQSLLELNKLLKSR